MTLVLKQSDWLKIFELPIRDLKTSVYLGPIFHFNDRPLVGWVDGVESYSQTWRKFWPAWRDLSWRARLWRCQTGRSIREVSPASSATRGRRRKACPEPNPMTEWTDRTWIHSVTDTVKLFFCCNCRRCRLRKPTTYVSRYEALSEFGLNKF